MTLADWAFTLSIASLVVSLVATMSRSAESKSTRRISVFSATIDKYVGQIGDSLLALEKLSDEYLEKGDYSSDADRKKLFDSINRTRRSVAVFINTILSNDEFESNGWRRFDEFFDDIMVHANAIKDRSTDDAVTSALNETITALSSARATAFSIRDRVFKTLLTT